MCGKGLGQLRFSPSVLLAGHKQQAPQTDPHYIQDLQQRLHQHQDHAAHIKQQVCVVCHNLPWHFPHSCMPV